MTTELIDRRPGSLPVTPAEQVSDAVPVKQLLRWQDDGGAVTATVERER